MRVAGQQRGAFKIGKYNLQNRPPPPKFELANGRRFTPHRTVYFSFGHDEEVGGECGAVKLAQRLADRGVQLEFVVDEGGEGSH